MRVMVTGGRGFIGKHLVKQLEKLGHTVSVVDFRGDQVADIRDSRRLELEVAIVKPSVIVHLAAKKYGDADEMHWTNTVATGYLIEAVKKAWLQSRVVFASTAAVYGSPQQDESAFPRTTTPYGASKYRAEMLLQHSGLPVTMLRLFNVYGSGGDGVINVLDECMRREETFYAFNKGVMMRDFIHVDRVVDIICKAVESPPNERLINVGTGVGRSVMGLIELAKLVNPTLRYVIESESARTDTFHSVADIRRLKNWLGSSVEVTGIQQDSEVLDFWRR